MRMKSIFVKLSPEELYRNITDEVQIIVEEWGLKEGVMLMEVRHTTCALIVQEDEPCLIQDLFDRLDAFARRSERGSEHLNPRYYRHDDFSIRTKNLNDDKCRERINGHAHCRASLFPSFIILWIINGKIDLGKWQQIIFLDFDDIGERKEREIRLSLITPL